MKLAQFLILIFCGERIVVDKGLSRYFFVACFVLAGGCSAMEPKASPDGIALLETAIAAIDSRDAPCEASEFSTDDQRILAVLRERDFEVVAHKAREDDDGIEHQFILKQRNSQMLLSADVVAVRDECSTYTFVRIAQDQ